MSLNNVTAVDLASSNTAVVRTLGTGEPALGPSIRPAVSSEESVFLFQTKPEFFLGVDLHQTVGLMTEVELVGCSIRIPGLAENEDVIATAERISEDSNRAEVDIGVVTGSLAGGRTVKVPFRELIDGFNGLGESLRGRIFELAKMNSQHRPALYRRSRVAGRCRLKSWLAVFSHRAQGLSKEGARLR